ncbi:MAG: TAXI family TRAP transporter solute-binding subunit [Rhodospirillales bacterium]
MKHIPAPRIDRQVAFHFQGDWGQANLHRICGWLMQELADNCGPGSRMAVWNGRGGADAAHAVSAKEVDLAFMVPAISVRMALDGTGLFEGSPNPRLRAIGTMPQTDRLILAIRSDAGIGSLEQLRAKKAPLRIATSQDDGVNTIGFAAQRMMEFCGIPRATLESWGGRYLEAERPSDCVDLVRRGEANAIIHEAIMTPYWHNLADSVDLTFLHWEDAALAEMERRYRWTRATVPQGFLRGMSEELTALEFSDFLAVARDDMPDDVAYLLAWCMCERRAALERQYAHIPPHRSPVTYPLEPARIAQTTIPLHPGAERYYRDAGLLPD